MKLDAEIKEFTQLLRRYQSGVAQLQLQKEKLNTARSQANAQLTKIVVNRETLKINGITSDLKEKMLEIKSINNLLALGGVEGDSSQPAGLEELSARRRSGVDKTKLAAIMKNRNAPVAPAEPVGTEPPVVPLVLPGSSGLPVTRPTQTIPATPIPACGFGLLVVKNLLKEEFRTQFATLSGRRDGGIVNEARLYELLGHPDRTQTVESLSYWYWVCKDGTMQMLIRGYKDPATEAKSGKGRLVVENINDY